MTTPTQARAVRSDRMTAAEYRARPSQKSRKYRNQPVVIDGIRFDSKAEGRRYLELKALEKDGTIRDLRRQVTYELNAGEAVICRYRADFDYVETSTGEPITEDVKGVETRDFKLKAKLFATQYGRKIRIVKL